LPVLQLVTGGRDRRRDEAARVSAADEHRKLAEAADAGGLLRPTGWIKV
jgi:hypothetical protein